MPGNISFKKYFTSPLHLLYGAYVCSIITYSNFHLIVKYNGIYIQDSSKSIPALLILSAVKGAGEGIRDFILFHLSLTIIFLLFLAGLKLICSIKLTELLLFILITIPALLLLLWFQDWLLPEILTGWSSSFLFILLPFFLLKVSGYWNEAQTT